MKSISSKQKEMTSKAESDSIAKTKEMALSEIRKSCPSIQDMKFSKEVNQMAKLNETALAYEGKGKIKNIAELNSVSTDLEVKEDVEAEFPYKYIEVDGEKYKVPSSVLGSLKAILEENPKLAKFKVKKTGEGMETRYTVIPLS